MRPSRPFDRTRLPFARQYYSQQFKNLKIKAEWALVRCCFHDDRNPSLSLNMIDGHFKCHACGAKGHDVLAFHQLRYNLNFYNAVTDLGAWHE